MITCQICGKEKPEHIFYCEEHYKCQDCGTKDKLCIYSEGVLCFSCHEKRVEKRIEEFDGDTNFMSEVVCPHCGYEHSDSWEKPDGEYDCNDCGRRFNITRNVEVTYSTDKVA